MSKKKGVDGSRVLAYTAGIATEEPMERQFTIVINDSQRNRLMRALDSFDRTSPPATYDDIMLLADMLRYAETDAINNFTM
jgi:hypothetical protein